MNTRAITWLLAALMALSAGAAVPVASARTDDAGCAIVWIAQERSEQQVLVQSRCVAGTRPAVLLKYEPPAKARHFAASLYQRPPPSLR